MSMQNRISGIVRLISPAHSGAATKSSGSGNIVGTASLWVQSKHGSTRIPIIPANSQRGGIRRVAADLVMESLRAKGTYSLRLYGGLRRGAADAIPAGGHTIGECLRARDNLFMGVFGGGARMFNSKYTTADMIAVTSAALEAGLVPQSVVDSEAAFIPKKTDGVPFNCFSSVKFFKRDDLLLATGKPELLANIENFQEAFAEYQDAAAENTAARKVMKAAKAAAVDGVKIEEVKKLDMAGIFEFEVIPAGVPMYFQSDCANSLTDAQIGFLALVLCEYANRQELGGIKRFGFGRFNANLSLTRHGEEFPFLVSNGNGEHSIAAPIQPFVKLARAALAELTAADMLTFYDDVPTGNKALSLKKAA